MPKFRRVPVAGGELVFALGVDPSQVVHQPGDRSMASAPQRSARIAAAQRAGREIAPPQLRMNRDGRLEVWDGNARLHRYREQGTRFDAVIVGPQGDVVRTANPSVPTEPELYDSLVAEVRGLVDRGRVEFRWPSSEATEWIAREYEAQGGRWRRPRRPRRRPAQERRQAARYLELYAEIDDAPDLWAVARAIDAGRRELGSPVLAGVLGTHGSARAAALGFRCPPRRNCADELVRALQGRQGRIFEENPARDARVRRYKRSCLR